MRSIRWRLLATASVGALIAALVLMVSAPTAQAKNWDHLTKMQKRLASGAMSTALAPATAGCVNPTGGGDEGDEADNECAPDSYSSSSSTTAANAGGYAPTGNGACAETLGNDVKVNQNCENVTDADLAGRGQAQNETSIAIDPKNPKNMLASQNDYRRGDGNCYGAYSRDGGRTWNDTTIPMSFTTGTTFGAAREYWQAGGDTSVAYDTKGNAYLSCQVFNRGSGVSPNPDQSSAFYVFRSTGNNGASWNFPGRPVAENNDVAGAGNVLEDKQLMTVDNHVGSPYQDRVYVSWTEFAADGSSYIYESFSSDYGETFSRTAPGEHDVAFVHTDVRGRHASGPVQREPVLPAVHRYGRGALRHVRQLQQQRPRGHDNRNQMLLAKSTDGGITFSAPVKVSDYYDLPDCATYQNSDPGRACVPEKGDIATVGVPCGELPERGRGPDEARPCGGHLRFLHQQGLEGGQRVRPDRLLAVSGSTPTPG